MGSKVTPVSQNIVRLDQITNRNFDQINNRAHDLLSGLTDDDHTQYSKVTTGTYTGNNTTNRAIPHGLGRTAKLVWIVTTDTAYTYLLMASQGAGWSHDGDSAGKHYIFTGVTAPDATNFYVGKDSMAYTMNLDTKNYRWVAFG